MLTCQKHEFEFEPDVHFLNCAYLGPVPRRVEEAGIAGIRAKRLPAGFPSNAFFDDADVLRQRFGTLVGCSPDRVAIQPAVSYAVATAAQNLDVRRGQNIVMLGEQFPSNVYCWRRLADETGVELRTVERPGPAPAGLEWNERILEAIDSDTAVVTLAHVHWTDGTRFDLHAIGARAREVGAALIVDGSQSIGVVPFDVAEIQPDMLVTAGYKWMLGPYQTSLTYMGPRFDGGKPLEESWIARRGSEDFQGLVDYVDDYVESAVRYDVGQRANFIQVPMMITAIELLLEWIPERILAYNVDLLSDLIDELRARGWRVEDDVWRTGHLLGIGLPDGMDLRELNRRLVAANVHVSLRGQSLRVSPHVYNETEDIDALREVLFV